MKIAFHSPLKSPRHPVPSGDRLMARLLIAALERAGHQVDVVSELRTFMKTPSAETLAGLQRQADAEIERLSALWRSSSPPDAWFSYHLYYKAPDLLGPRLCRLFSLPYVTAEASYSARRNAAGWLEAQDLVKEAVDQAEVNICLTRRDHDGLFETLPGARLAMLEPFLDTEAFLACEHRPRPNRLITVAMMRAGDKMDSYRMLAESLTLLSDLDWTLAIIGDGPCLSETQALLAGFGPGRIDWLGEKSQSEIAALLSESAVYVWPGCGEAYGLAYLEAQAAGLPVVAQAIAGVPEVVANGCTGLLTPAGNVAAFADAIRRLLTDGSLRKTMSEAARTMVRDERSLEKGSVRLADILNDIGT